MTMVNAASSLSPSLIRLFQDHKIILIGDKLDAFYLHHKAAQKPDSLGYGLLQDDAFLQADPLVNKKTKAIYSLFVMAAAEAGMRDIVIDMPMGAQPGIDLAVQTYKDELASGLSEEALLSALLNDNCAMPMDAVVLMAGTHNMKVHALNTGLTGVATIYREAKGILTVPYSDNDEERVANYIANGFTQDKQVLERLLRRPATSLEIDTMFAQMKMRLSKFGMELENKIYDETPTQTTIVQTLGNKPFLGFFQTKRLFASEEYDLDTKLRQAYGEASVARLCQEATADLCLPKKPQYALTDAGIIVPLTRHETDLRTYVAHKYIM